MQQQPNGNNKEKAQAAASGRHEAEARALLAKHLHPPKVEKFKGIRL